MADSSPNNNDAPPLRDASRRLFRRIIVICENRLELLLVEAQEEREHILHAIWLGLIFTGFGLLTGITLTLAITIAFWQYSPVFTLLCLAGLYLAGGILSYLKLLRLQRDWQTLPHTIEQFKKDRECLENRSN